MTSIEIIRLLSGVRFPLQDEKETQDKIEQILKVNGVSYEREYRLDAKNIPDFYVNGIAIEVKIKGGKRMIYKQCERYCEFDNVKELILVTNKSMGFPKSISGKSCYVINLGRAWL